MKLRSYAHGEWVEGAGKPVELFHAVTGEKVAEANSEGLDFRAMLEYGRTVGGPKLRKMTFHERAAMLKAMAKYLMERKEEFYQASATAICSIRFAATPAISSWRLMSRRFDHLRPF